MVAIDSLSKTSICAAAVAASACLRNRKADPARALVFRKSRRCMHSLVGVEKENICPSMRKHLPDLRQADFCMQSNAAKSPVKKIYFQLDLLVETARDIVSANGSA